MKIRPLVALPVSLFAFAACSPEPEGLAPAQSAATTVKMDFFHRPLPEIALPNDVATRYDEASATRRRINASMVAPTGFESRTRELLDQLDGWGVLQPIVVPFTGPLDVESVIDGHRDVHYETENDVIYLVDIDPASPHRGEIQHLDLGNGNYPVTLEKRDLYWKNDPRGESMSLPFEETDEDADGDGVLDPGEDRDGDGVLGPGEDADGDGVLDPPEDTDADGIFDFANYLPGPRPAKDDLAGRADALMTFYERSTNTLIARPMVPLRERTRYAVVVTRRIRDASGEPVGSPYAFINHAAQTEELTPLLDVLPAGLSTDDVAFTYSFTTQSIESPWIAVRDGLYGHGAQAHLASQFPAEIASIEPLRDQQAYPEAKNLRVLPGEHWRPAMEEILSAFGGSGGLADQIVVEGTGFIDYLVIGSFVSPQLFPRTDSAGAPLGLNDQSWPPDLDRAAANARPETVYFTLAVPRKEISARGEGKPAPVAIVGHGYGSSRFEAVQFAGYVAAHGIATLSIDGPSHGLGLAPLEVALAKGLLDGHGLGPLGEALFLDRGFDQNGDGKNDSGADFWTSYMFHTRDIVRQFALDYMQLVRIVKTFDGEKRWGHDVDGDGESELAGDFDGDGELDIGASSSISVFGGSLGGIMSTILGGLEPDVDAIAPVSGGGGYSDIGIRSVQGGVYQAFILRVMGPLYVGTIDAASGEMLVETIVPDLNSDATLPLARIPGLKAWDTMVVENLANGRRGCGFVSPEGTVRATVESDVGDATRIVFYAGPQLVAGSTECELYAGAQPIATIDTFGESIEFQTKPFEEGSPLMALAEGLGLRRGHPDLRRMQGLGQLILDPADPAVLAPHLLREPLYYPGTGQQTGAHALIVTTMGDMAVPASSGITCGRAAGLIDYVNDDPRFGKPANQVLLETYTAEAVHNLGRYVNEKGESVHYDIENFSGGDDLYGTDVPRAETPLHLGFDGLDALGGKSAAIFPYNIPEGQHGFDMPGGMTDRAREQCAAACPSTEGDDPCGCASLETFDIGRFMMNMIGRYMKSGGRKLSADLCQSRNDCADIAPIPPARPDAELP